MYVKKIPQKDIWEKIKVGDVAFFKTTISKNKVMDFISLSGDKNLLHRDKKFAKSKDFLEPVVHGMLLAAFFSTLVGKFFKNHNLYLSQNINFKKPVFIGETVTVRGKIKNKINSVYLLEIETVIINQNNEEVVNGIAKVKYI
ncbi:MAG: MaoC family dehydratase [Patescibacteria group bacterium]